jgi:hypothetical protein
MVTNGDAGFARASSDTSATTITTLLAPAAISSTRRPVAPQWRPGDRIPLGPGRALEVVGERMTDVDEIPVLIVEDVAE